MKIQFAFCLAMVMLALGCGNAPASSEIVDSYILAENNENNSAAIREVCAPGYEMVSHGTYTSCDKTRYVPLYPESDYEIE